MVEEKYTWLKIKQMQGAKQGGMVFIAIVYTYYVSGIFWLVCILSHLFLIEILQIR